MVRLAEGDREEKIERAIRSADAALQMLGVLEIERIEADPDLDASRKRHAQAAVRRLSASY